jgi:hypothetical protein
MSRIRFWGFEVDEVQPNPGHGRCAFVYPTQAKRRLEWGTRMVLDIQNQNELGSKLTYLFTRTRALEGLRPSFSAMYAGANMGHPSRAQGLVAWKAHFELHLKHLEIDGGGLHTLHLSDFG